MNSVMAGLVEQPEDWEFSIYREYISLRSGMIPTPEVGLSRFPSFVVQDLRGLRDLGGLADTYRLFWR